MLKVKVEIVGANCLWIYTDDGVYLQSYNTIIAYHPHKGQIILDAKKWDASVTTSKHRNHFLNETKKDTERKIKDGIYLLTDLN